MINYYQRISGINELIDQVHSYPVSVGQLINLARAVETPTSVVNFYRSLPEGVVFETEDDLRARSELLELMNREEAEQPYEVMVSSEED